MTDTDAPDKSPGDGGGETLEDWEVAVPVIDYKATQAILREAELSLREGRVVDAFEQITDAQDRISGHREDNQ